MRALLAARAVRSVRAERAVHTERAVSAVSALIGMLIAWAVSETVQTQKLRDTANIKNTAYTHTTMKRHFVHVQKLMLTEMETMRQ